MAPSSNITVFEAANDDLKELYVTRTALPIFQAIAEISTKPVPAIRHWMPQRQQISFRSLAFNLTEESAQAFIARHIAERLAQGWTLLTDSSPKTIPRDKKR